MGLLDIEVSESLLSDLLHLNSSDYGHVEIINAGFKGYDTIILTLKNDKFPGRQDDGSIVISHPVLMHESTRIIDWNI